MDASDYLAEPVSTVEEVAIMPINPAGTAPQDMVTEFPAVGGR